METYQTKLDAGEKPGNITRAQSPTVWQQGMLDTQASQATGREAAFGESWLQGMRATQEKLGNAMQNRQRPTKTGEALLGWLQPKLSQLEEKYNLPPGLLRSVAITESRGNQFAVSPAGAMGLFQFMPKTASEFGLRGNDAFDPEKAADAAARKLGGLIRFFMAIWLRLWRHITGEREMFSVRDWLLLRRRPATIFRGCWRTCLIRMRQWPYGRSILRLYRSPP